MQTARILVIDDDYDVLKSAHLLLKRFYSEVHIEQIPENISRRISKENYDVVLLDMIMPRMGGTETFHRLREINPQARILVTSGYSVNDEVEALLKEGACGFLQKPFRKEEFRVKMAAAQSCDPIASVSTTA